MSFSLPVDDAADLGQFLRFLDDWLASDQGLLSQSLTRFVGWDAYNAHELRSDLTRFMFLLGESNGEEPVPPPETDD